MTNIEGLWVPSEEQVVTPVLATMRAGAPDVSEAVGVTIEAFRDLGSKPNQDQQYQATLTLTQAYSQLADLGYDGRLYVEPPQSVSFGMLLEAADNKRAKNVDTLYRYPNLWTPGTEANSYTARELDGSPATEPQARIAVFNADEATGVDPLLHFLNTPYDDMYRGNAQQTQLEGLEATTIAFEGQHPGSTVHALGHRAAVMLVLMDRVRGTNAVNPRSADFILNQGFLRIPELGRREVGGGSYVGYVDSNVSRLLLDGSDGYAYPDFGVGVSVGLEKSST